MLSAENKKRHKISVVEILVFLIITGYCLPLFTFKTSMASSGGIPIYVADFALAGLLLVSMKAVLQEKYSPRILQGLCFYFFVIISLWYLAATIYRYIGGYAFYKSFALFYRTAAPVCVGTVIIGSKNRERILAITNVALSLVFIGKIATDFYWQRVQTDFLVNKNMVVYVAILTLFLSEIGHRTAIKSKLVTVSMLFNTIYCIVFLLVSGSRLGTFSLIISLCCILVIWRDKEVFLRHIFCICVAGILVCAIFRLDFFGMRFLFFRGFDLHTIKQSISDVKDWSVNEPPPGVDEPSPGVDEPSPGVDEPSPGVDEPSPGVSPEIDFFDASKIDSMTQEEILVANDSLRFAFWVKGIEKIKKEPFWGTGEVSVFVMENYGGQPPHNFLLEYGIIYGLGGLVCWIVFVFMYVFISLKKMKLNRKRAAIFISVLLIALGNGFLQPLLCTGVGPSITWIVLSIISSDNTKVATTQTAVEK